VTIWVAWMREYIGMASQVGKYVQALAKRPSTWPTSNEFTSG